MATSTSNHSQTAPTDSSSLHLPLPASTINPSHSKSPQNKRALLIAIRHITRKAALDLPDLRFSHRDVKALREFLIDSRGYHPDDITSMMDDKNTEEHLLPTRHRVLHQIDEFTRNAPENCHFFFYFSGHGLQEECDHQSTRPDDRDDELRTTVLEHGPEEDCGCAGPRADGRDDEIVCANGECILAHILHDRLVTPLQSVKGSKLFALFDCCHSETLLDLQSGSGPNSYSKQWTIGRGQWFKAITTAIIKLLALNTLCHRRRPNGSPPRRASTKWCSPPVSETKEVGELGVICLSACRDGQLAHDDCERELTFTKCFLDAMAEKPNITWLELRDTLKELVSDIRKRYEEVYLQDSDSESSLSHGAWAQEPRYCTSSHTDLTRKVSL